MSWISKNAAEDTPLCDLPKVSHAKWIEPRLPHDASRWEVRYRADNIHEAFLNGVGSKPWENVWDIWNGMRERGGELLRRVASIKTFRFKI